MTSPLMKPTLVGRDTLHELDQPLKKLAYVSNRWGPLLSIDLENSSVCLWPYAACFCNAIFMANSLGVILPNDE